MEFVHDNVRKREPAHWPDALKGCPGNQTPPKHARPVGCSIPPGLRTPPCPQDYSMRPWVGTPVSPLYRRTVRVALPTLQRAPLAPSSCASPGRRPTCPLGSYSPQPKKFGGVGDLQALTWPPLRVHLHPVTNGGPAYVGGRPARNQCRSSRDAYRERLGNQCSCSGRCKAPA